MNANEAVYIQTVGWQK